MADVRPNYLLEQARIKAQIAQQEATIAEQWLGIMEMADRKDRYTNNIEAASKAISDLKEQLKSLETEHGALTEEKLASIEKSLNN